MASPDDPLLRNPARTAVVGCGLAGATCARLLGERGHEVHVFDKARGPGGRLSSRRVDGGAVDHGAPAFGVSSEPFARAVDDWEASGVVAPWRPTAARVRSGTLGPAAALETYVGCPRMSALVRHVLGRSSLQTSSRVDSVARTDAGWVLTLDDARRTDSFDELVLALPAPQTAALEGVPRSVAGPLEAVGFDSTWTILVQFAHRVSSRFDLLIFDEGPLERAARVGSKPGRPEAGWWTIQASPAWSRERIGDDPDSVIGPLLEAFTSAFSGPPPEVSSAAAHRWRFARVSNPIAAPFVRDADLGVTACGDFGRDHAGVEGSWMSGRGAARAILETTGARFL